MVFSACAEARLRAGCLSQCLRTSRSGMSRALRVNEIMVFFFSLQAQDSPRSTSTRNEKARQGCNRTLPAENASPDADTDRKERSTTQGTQIMVFSALYCGTPACRLPFSMLTCIKLFFSLSPSYHS